MLFQSLDSGLRRNDDLIRTSLMSSTDFASRAPKGSPNTKGNGSTDLRCVVSVARPGCPGAEVSRQGRRERLVRSARAPKPEERRVGLRHPGRPFFWLLFFAR